MTSNHDLRRMREQALSGATVAECCRALHLTRDCVEWWNKREHLGFVPMPRCGHAAPHPMHADFAIARLEATWRRVCDAARGAA